MRKYLCSLMMAWAITSSSQISIITTSTPSICYNDGTISVKASGGVAPYLYSIISGPVHPNLNYPIILPAGSDTFIDLPHGTFSILVTDAASHIDTFSASVAGTYQFPSLTFDTTSISGIIAHVSGGRAPYEYAISSTGSNTGFGPYLYNDTFNRQCPGQYWVRVIDSCGNIYTSAVSFSYTINATTTCVNYSKGTLNVIASGGHAPYIYRCTSGSIQISNTSGNFIGLSHYSSDLISVTDSCGVSYSYSISPTVITFDATCPFDSNLYYSSGFSFSDNFTITCASCIPQQTYSGNYVSLLYNDTIFKHLSHPYSNDIVIIRSGCGGDTLHYQININTPALYLNYNYISCRSSSFYASDMYNHIYPVDSFVAVSGSGVYRFVNTTGYFYDLPINNGFTVTAYLGDSNCHYTLTQSTYSGAFFNDGEIEMEDSSCQLSWAYTLVSNPNAGAERFYLVSGFPGYTMDTTILIHNGDFDWGYNIAPNVYTLVSDSGCSIEIGIPNISYSPSVASFVSCTGASTLRISPGNLSSFGDVDVRVKLFSGNNLILDTITTTNPSNFTNLDTGLYHYEMFIYPLIGDLTAQRFDSICPYDSGSIYVTNSSIPYPFPSHGYVCHLNNSNNAVPYHIYGGSLPYTIEILGYDTFSLSTNSGIFRVPHPGNYTMLVYDNCGISRSYTFSVIDTCTHCPIAAFSVSTIRSCAGDTVFLTNASIDATSYEWLVNGSIYSNSRDTFLITDVGGDRILLRAFSQNGCKDSTSAFIVDSCHVCYIYNNIMDSICYGSYYSFNNYLVNQGGTYIDTIPLLNGCDSIAILHLFVNPLSSTIRNDTICQGSTVHIGGHIYYQAGIYMDTIASAGGCDSAITLHLMVYPNSSKILYDTIFTGDTFYVAGYAYTQPGIYFNTLTNRHGCDSSITLYLYVIPATTYDYLFDTICQGFAVVVGGHTYTVGGTYIDSLTGTMGGDSIVVLSLTVYPISSTSFFDSICQGSSLTVAGHQYTQSGIYTDTLLSIHGCDSIITLDLMVFSPPTSVWSYTHTGYIFHFNDSVTSGVPPYTYAWDFGDDTVISHTSDPTHIYMKDSLEGKYTVTLVVTDACGSDTLTEVVNAINGIHNLTLDELVSVYPNPNQGSFTIAVSSRAETNLSAEIIDVLGQTVYKQNIHTGENRIDQALNAGIYTVKVSDGEVYTVKMMSVK